MIVSECLRHLLRLSIEGAYRSKIPSILLILGQLLPEGSYSGIHTHAAVAVRQQTCFLRSSCCIFSEEKKCTVAELLGLLPRAVHGGLLCICSLQPKLIKLELRHNSPLVVHDLLTQL